MVMLIDKQIDSMDLNDLMILYIRHSKVFQLLFGLLYLVMDYFVEDVSEDPSRTLPTE